MTTETYPIKGIPPASDITDLPLRREINQWIEDGDNEKQIDLFMLALRDMQKTPIEDLLSYFRIAGIHSYPLQDWDGVKYVPRERPNSKPGFCAHNISIFPTWHRPYMLLFENIKSWKLSDADAKSWLYAANTFRLPYWDWAQIQPYINDYGIPEICTRETVTVTLPGGKTESFVNPLSGFTNPKGVAMGDESMGKYKVPDNPGKGVLPWSKCIGTSRYGVYKDKDPSTWNKGVNDWEKVNVVVRRPEWYAQGAKSTFADAVERLLSPNYHSTYEKFACTYFNDPGDDKNTSYMSLEYIHNVAHVAAGGFWAYTDKQGKEIGATGLGHMSDVPVSAFDPLFWLHHCNIDRLLAIWQTFNSDKWFGPESKPGPGEALLPFHNSTSGDFWNSEQTRKWTNYNYQYDDLVVLPQDKDPNGEVNMERYVARLRTYFNILYPGSSNAVKAAPMFQSDQQTFPDFIVNIIYDRYALDGRAYSIMLFLGEPPADDELYLYNNHPNYLGQVYTFSSPIELEGTTACGNCESQRGEQVLSAAQIPVTIQLMQKASLQQEWHAGGQEGLPPLGVQSVVEGALDPEIVQQIFAAQLRVVYVELGGDVHNASEFPRTEIALLHAPATFTVQDYASFSGGEPAESVVPNYDGQYKVLYKYMGGTRPDAFEAPLLGQAASRVGLIRDDA